jgi:hypothetical protein
MTDGNRSTKRKISPTVTLSPQIPHGLKPVLRDKRPVTQLPEPWYDQLHDYAPVSTEVDNNGYDRLVQIPGKGD